MSAKIIRLLFRLSFANISLKEPVVKLLGGFMFIGYIIANEVAYAVVQNAKDVLDAKNRCAKYINDKPTEFKNGYECYITDRSTHQVVSFATVPQPSLEWQDTKS